MMLLPPWLLPAIAWLAFGCGSKLEQHRQAAPQMSSPEMAIPQLEPSSNNIEPARADDAMTKKKETITFAGSRGDQVPGYLWLPERGATSKLPVVMAMYGIGGDKDDRKINEAAEVLAENGFAVVTIDWPGTGERGSIDKASRVLDVDVLNWTVDDYKSTLTYLSQRPEIDVNRVAFVGASMGAMTGLAFSSIDSRVKAVVPIVPIPNPLWGTKDPSVTIQSIAPRPVLCISAADNSDLSGLVCNNTKENGRSLALPGGHELTGFEDKVIEETLKFLQLHLN